MNIDRKGLALLFYWGYLIDNRIHILCQNSMEVFTSFLLYIMISTFSTKIINNYTSSA